MRGLHTSMMSIHGDRRQNCRTPHCLISTGNRKLINLRFRDKSCSPLPLPTQNWASVGSMLSWPSALGPVLLSHGFCTP